MLTNGNPLKQKKPGQDFRPIPVYPYITSYLHLFCYLVIALISV